MFFQVYKEPYHSNFFWTVLPLIHLNPLTPTCNTCLPKSQNFGETGKVNTMRSKV